MLRRLFMLVLATLVVASGASAGSARLKVTGLSPVTVRGTGFASHERVRVTARASGESATRSLITGAAGGFVARFQTITVGSCTAYVIRAVGATGDTAILRVRAPECPQPLTP